MDTVTRDSRHREIVLFLECVPVLSGLNLENVNFIAGLSSRVSLKPGELLFSEGDPGDAVFVVERGGVDVFTVLPNRDELVLAHLGKQELIGEHYILDGASGLRSASVRANQYTDLFRIGHTVFDRLLKRNPEVAKQLAWRRMQREQDNLARRSELYRIIREAPLRTPTLRRVYQPGEVVFREGDPADEVFVISSGEAVVFSEQNHSQILGRLLPGQCFGERAVINDAPRSASVRAESRLDVQVISRENFVRLHEQSADLRDVVCALEFTYQLPSEGIVLQYTSQREGEQSIERVYELSDGRRFLSTFFIHRMVFKLENIGELRGPLIRDFSWRAAEGGAERSISLGPMGDIFGITVSGYWDQLPSLIQAALDATPITPQDIKAFVETGRFTLAEKGRLPDPTAQDELACFCLQIPVSRIKTLVDSGYASFEALRKTTGCGAACGGCRTRICDLMNPPDWIPVSASASTLTPLVRAVRLTPSGARRYPPWSAGQHVVLEGRMHGQWVGRPYLITSVFNGDTPIEITVQRVEGGKFTRWLFDGRIEHKQLRVSMPLGQIAWSPKRADTVCIVHEIGICLAAAIARTIISRNLGDRLHIEFYGEDIATMPYLSELQSASISHPNISIKVRRMPFKRGETSAIVSHLTSRFVGAHFYISVHAAESVGLRQAFLKAGVPDDCVFEEPFSRGPNLRLKVWLVLRNHWKLVSAVAGVSLLVLGWWLRRVG